jgi:4-hydroxy-2-oxoheptanedioate aldolase
VTDGERPPFWPRPNSFRKSLHGIGRPQAFMWVTLPSTEVVEMAGALGLDCVIVDMEHTTADLERVHQLVSAAQGAGMNALVRVESADAEVGRVLDLGAQGVVFPRVSSAEQARRAAAAMSFPPNGSRGWHGAHARSVRWTGTTIDGSGDVRLLSPEYIAAADSALARVFMIEDAHGADQIDMILDSGRPDGVMFGWADFSLSVKFDADRLSAARSRVFDACHRRGIGVAISVVPPDETTFYPGCFYSVGVDTTVLASALMGRLAAVRVAIDQVLPTGDLQRPD